MVAPAHDDLSLGTWRRDTDHPYGNRMFTVPAGLGLWQALLESLLSLLLLAEVVTGD